MSEQVKSQTRGKPFSTESKSYIPARELTECDISCCSAACICMVAVIKHDKEAKGWVHCNPCIYEPRTVFVMIFVGCKYTESHTLISCVQMYAKVATLYKSTNLAVAICNLAV